MYVVLRRVVDGYPTRWPFSVYTAVTLLSSSIHSVIIYCSLLLGVDGKLTISFVGSNLGAPDTTQKSFTPAFFP